MRVQARGLRQEGPQEKPTTGRTQGRRRGAQGSSLGRTSAPQGWGALQAGPSRPTLATWQPVEPTAAEQHRYWVSQPPATESETRSGPVQPPGPIPPPAGGSGTGCLSGAGASQTGPRPGPREWEPPVLGGSRLHEGERIWDRRALPGFAVGSRPDTGPHRKVGMIPHMPGRDGCAGGWQAAREHECPQSASRATGRSHGPGRASPCRQVAPWAPGPGSRSREAIHTAFGTKNKWQRLNWGQRQGPGSHLGSVGAAPSGRNTPRPARSGPRATRGTRRHSGSRSCRRLWGPGRPASGGRPSARTAPMLAPDAQPSPTRPRLTVLGLLLLSREDEGAAWPPRVRERVTVLLELVLGEQVLLEAAVQGGPWGWRGAVSPQLGQVGQPCGGCCYAPGGKLHPREPGSPFRSSTRGLLGRLSEKLVLAANLPPSITSWDTTFRLLASRRGEDELASDSRIPPRASLPRGLSSGKAWLRGCGYSLHAPPQLGTSRSCCLQASLSALPPERKDSNTQLTPSGSAENAVSRRGGRAHSCRHPPGPSSEPHAQSRSTEPAFEEAAPIAGGPSAQDPEI